MNPYRLVATASALLACSFAPAQGTDDGWGLGSPDNRRYDTLSEVSFTGRVIGVHRMSPQKGMSGGVIRISSSSPTLADSLTGRHPVI